MRPGYCSSPGCERSPWTRPIRIPPISPGAGRPRLPVHRLVADAGGIIVENLTAVDEIDFADPWLSVLPLRIVGRGRRTLSRGRLHESGLSGN